MKTHTIFIIFICFILAACETIPGKPDNRGLEDTIFSNKSKTHSSIAHSLDTTILLTDLAKSNYTGQNLTSAYAKKILYSYFKSKGYYTSDNLPELEKLTDSVNDKLIVEYDSVFITNLNGNENLDAVITYWLTLPYANGHCWQLHKAIIVDTNKGYRITNEEFIPNNFAIDSVVTKDLSVTVYGYDYDCENHEILRNIRVKIK